MKEILNGTLDPKIEEARIQIGAIQQEIAMMGGNDHEPSAIADILKRLEEKACSPENAVIEARAILDAKQDYH